MEKKGRDKVEEFFLESFNVDRIFNSIERADYLFLYYITICEKKSEKSDGVYLAEIAAEMNLPIPQISKAVKGLQEKGLVEWKMNAEKDRTYVELTGNAIELMNDERLRMEKVYDLIREKIPSDELENMIRTMKKITDIVKKTQNDM